MNDIRNMAAVKVATDLLTDVNARLVEYREIRKSVAADAKAGKGAATDALERLDALIAREATIAALISANVPEHEWDGTSVRLRNVDGEWGQWVDLRGAKGDEGEPGSQGISAYQQAVNAGFTGSVSQWLATIAAAKTVEDNLDGIQEVLDNMAAVLAAPAAAKAASAAVDNAAKVKDHIPLLIQSWTPTIIGRSNRMSIAGRHLYISSRSHDSFEIYDIGSPSFAPRFVASHNPGAITELPHVAVSGHVAVTIDRTSGELVTVNVSNPSSPTDIGSVTDVALEGAWHISIKDDVAYISVADNAKSEGRFVSVDISNPGSPQVLDSLSYTEVRESFIVGETAFVVDQSEGRLLAIDVSDPTSLVEIGSLSTDELGEARAVAVKGDIAIVAGRDHDNVISVDVSDPTDMIQLDSLTSPNIERSHGVVIAGDYAYVPCVLSGKLVSIDISDPNELQEVASLSVSGQASGVALDGETIYVLDRHPVNAPDRIIRVGRGTGAEKLRGDGVNNAILEIVNDAQFAEFHLTRYVAGGNSMPVFIMKKSRGSEISPENIIQNDLIGAMQYATVLGDRSMVRPIDLTGRVLAPSPSASDMESGLELRVCPPSSVTRTPIINASFANGVVIGSGLKPTHDDTLDLGSASFRFDNVYATTATIQTSDAREKKIRGPLSEAEIRAGNRIAPVVYQWLSAIEVKGAEDARLHTGFVAQEVRDALLAEGLDPGRYAFFTETLLEEAITELYEEEDGSMAERRTVRPAMDGTAQRIRYGLRVSELMAFLYACQQAAMLALESRIAALEGAS